MALVGLLALGAAVVGGWTYYTGLYPSWYEEVRLSDGRIITIHQKHEYYENYGTNQSWVEIDLPELGGRQVWHSYLKPQRVDVVDGKVYVFGIPRGDRQLEHYRYPRYFMVAFVWSDGEFKRIPYLSVPVQARTEENVFRCVPRPVPHKLNISTKDSAWCAAQGHLGKSLDLSAYQRVADEWAEISRWTDRSE